MKGRLLLTRPFADSLATMEKLSAMGYASLLSPVSVVTPLEAPFPPPFCVAGILSSRNAIRALPETRRDFFRKTLSFYAIGEKTAAEARNAGFSITGAASKNAASLIKKLSEKLPQESALLHICGVPSKPFLPEGLAQCGFRVYTHVVYRTEDVDSLTMEALSAFKENQITGVLHYSRENARRFMTIMLQSPMPSAPLSVKHFCISSDAAQALEGVPDALIALACAPTEESLLTRLTQNLQLTNGEKNEL